MTLDRIDVIAVIAFVVAGFLDTLIAGWVVVQLLFGVDWSVVLRGGAWFVLGSALGLACIVAFAWCLGAAFRGG